MLYQIVSCLLVVVFVQVETVISELPFSCRPSCNNPCKYGHIGYSMFGCMDCRCKQNPNAECRKSFSCYGKSSCQYGAALDDKGCYTCDCAPSPNRPRPVFKTLLATAGPCLKQCNNKCPFGHIKPGNGRPGSGCSDCRCKQNSNGGCKQIPTCCEGYCKKGCMLDQKGCYTSCDCRPVQ